MHYDQLFWRYHDFLETPDRLPPLYVPRENAVELINEEKPGRGEFHPHGRNASGPPDRLPAGDRLRKNGWMTKDTIRESVQNMLKTEYGQHLIRLVQE